MKTKMKSRNDSDSDHNDDGNDDDHNSDGSNDEGEDKNSRCHHHRDNGSKAMTKKCKAMKAKSAAPAKKMKLNTEAPAANKMNDGNSKVSAISRALVSLLLLTAFCSSRNEKCYHQSLAL
jgi:ABC-type Zn2+ transport system substrate-binding protein/surface adhesin